jgi:two-component system chemotaxis response regulator CheY
MSKTILYVDDSTTLQMSMKSMLSVQDYQVELAGDGIEAMDKLKGGLKPDLIITDINMPRMGGFELIKNVRALASFRFTPILTMTTESQQDKRDEGKRLGATGWLVKPTSSSDLLAILHKLLPGT